MKIDGVQMSVEEPSKKSKMSQFLDRMLNPVLRLKRVPFRCRVRLVKYYLRRLLRVGYSEDDEKLNTLLGVHLAKRNGYLLSLDRNTFTSRYTDKNGRSHTLTIRKFPSSDCNVAERTLHLCEYQPLVELIRKNCRPDELEGLSIIDAGGNIGSASIYLNIAFPKSRFIIVEPDIDNFEILSRNVAQNNFSGSKLVRGGVWSKSSFLKIDRDFRDKNDWSVRVLETEEPTELKGYGILDLMTLGGFERIDILKIDIEGAEKEIFRDKQLASEFLKKTKFIAIEIHDEFDCRDQINECLRENNFIFFTSGELTFAVNRNLVGSAVL
jgi:FkbM family methyltransferase